MKRCSAVLLSLVFLFAIPLNTAQAYKPTPFEDLYQLENLSLLRPGVTCKMFSSYDRTGGNNDGFQGTYSFLRKEDGDSVIAEMNGAGCIHRIWFTHSLHKTDGLLNSKGEHIRIYLDGEDKPTVDIPLEALFSGELEQFPSPLAGSGLGGFYCYTPIPYNNGCKVVVDGEGVRFYQVTYSEYPKDNAPETFFMQFSPERKAALKKAVEVWSSLGDLSVLDLEGSKTDTHEITLNEGKSWSLDLPQGKHQIRAILFKNQNPETLPEGWIKLYWDGREEPAVDLPLAYFFGDAFEPDSYQSLFFGKKEDGYYYQLMPMPYFQSARVELSALKNLRGKLQMILQPLPAEPSEVAYFHTDQYEQIPTEDGLHYPLLFTEGTGHFVGLFLITNGGWQEPVWLEGDEKFTVDGELTIHGTGTEDYFNCGWYSTPGRLNEPGAFPLHGFPLFRHADGDLSVTAYRWHLTDPVPYQKSIEAKIEHGPANNVPANYRSAVFFYDTRPGKIESRLEVPSGDEAIEYLGNRLWQLGRGDLEQARKRLNELNSSAQREINKLFLEGCRAYIEGMHQPEEVYMAGVQRAGETIDDLIGEIEKTGQEIPESYETARKTLRTAEHDLGRKWALIKGFLPGDEILIEVRGVWGMLNKGQEYQEMDPFTDSTAKTVAERLVGKGARFVYESTRESRARFIPDIQKEGCYEVFVIFSWAANAGDTRYLVRHAQGETTVPLEQRGRPGTEKRNHEEWHSLGKYVFKKGQNPRHGSVTLMAPAGGSRPNEEIEYRAYADSVRFVYQGEGQ